MAGMAIPFDWSHWKNGVAQHKPQTAFHHWGSVTNRSVIAPHSLLCRATQSRMNLERTRSRADCLSCFGSLRQRPIVEPLAGCALNRGYGSVAVIHPAGVPPEVKLSDVTGQVFLADRMVYSHDAAL